MTALKVDLLMLGFLLYDVAHRFPTRDKFAVDMRVICRWRPACLAGLFSSRGRIIVLAWRK